MTTDKPTEPTMQAEARKTLERHLNRAINNDQKWAAVMDAVDTLRRRRRNRSRRCRPRSEEQLRLANIDALTNEARANDAEAALAELRAALWEAVAFAIEIEREYERPSLRSGNIRRGAVKHLMGWLVDYRELAATPAYECECGWRGSFADSSYHSKLNPRHAIYAAATDLAIRYRAVLADHTKHAHNYIDLSDPDAERLLADWLREHWPVFDPTARNGYRGGPFDMDAEAMARAILAALRPQAARQPAEPSDG